MNSSSSTRTTLKTNLIYPPSLFYGGLHLFYLGGIAPMNQTSIVPNEKITRVELASFSTETCPVCGGKIDLATCDYDINEKPICSSWKCA